MRQTIHLRHLTPADGEWLAATLPVLQPRARPAANAVRIEDVVLRHRSGRIGIADAMDATATLLEPFSVAGASVERRADWYINDEDEVEDEEERAPGWLRAADLMRETLATTPPDLEVSARVVVDAAGADAGAAAIYWAVLALAAG